jgi:predicted nucleic acid-binding protein
MGVQVLHRPRFALDTNVLIDLGEGLPFAQRFLAAFRKTGLAVPPTAVQELVFIASSPDHHAQKFAAEALSKMRAWEVWPYDLKAVGHGITEVNAKKLVASGILPDGEFNDGLIVVETALACIATLITSDAHLLKINPPELTQKLAEFDLPSVSIYHPRDFLR